MSTLDNTKLQTLLSAENGGLGVLHRDDATSLDVDELVAITAYSRGDLRISVKRISGWEDLDLIAKKALIIGVGNASIVNFTNLDYVSNPNAEIRVRSTGMAEANSQFIAMDDRLDTKESSLSGRFTYLAKIPIVAA